MRSTQCSTGYVPLGFHCTSLIKARFRQITQFPTDFCRGRHFSLCLSIKGRFVHLDPPDWGLCRFVIPVPIRVLGQVPIHVVLRCGAPSDPHTSTGIMGSVLITDPRGKPLPPDQFSFSARRRSIAVLGDIIR